MNTFEMENGRKSIKKFMVAEFAILVGLGLVCGIGYGSRTGRWSQILEILFVGIAVLSVIMFLMHQRAKHHLLKCSEQIKQDC